MKFTLLDLYSFSIGIAAIIGVVRFKKINPAYYPFLYLVWVAFANEIICYFLIYSGYYNAIPYNIYVILESSLITWQFRKWGLFRKPRYFFQGLLISFVSFWAFELFLLKNFTQIITYFRILYSFVIVLMSIAVLSRLMVRERAPILRHSTFLICFGFIIYFTFSVLVGIFWLWGLDRNVQFVTNIVWILIYLNVFANLIYALAVLWMPRRQQFTMPL